MLEDAGQGVTAGQVGQGPGTAGNQEGMVPGTCREITGSQSQSEVAGWDQPPGRTSQMPSFVISPHMG